MGLKNEDVIQALTQDGIALERWLAVDHYLVGYFDDTGRLMLQIIEDGALAAAASKLLQKRGQIYDAGNGDAPA